jgi:hypothetical protein
MILTEGNQLDETTREEQQRLQQEHGQEYGTEAGHIGVETDHSGDTSAVSQPAKAHCDPARIKPAPLRPSTEEVVAAVASLYFDRLKPYGRFLRKRIVERHLMCSGDTEAQSKAQIGMCKQVLEVDIEHLRAVCDKSHHLEVMREDGGDWSVSLIGCPSHFVDAYSTVDSYPDRMWEDIADYLGNSEEHVKLPGGRYSCAQALLARQLPFFAGRSLGEINHIVQLAMTRRKLLGYLNGSVVPYSRSKSMVKETCAVQKSVATACIEAADMPHATWEQTTCLLSVVLEEAAKSSGAYPGIVALSNVKRLFRTRFSIELSETKLGYSKLSDLLQDPRFADVCEVQLEGGGYAVVQRGHPNCDEVASSSNRQFSLGKPLFIDIAVKSTDEAAFGSASTLIGQTLGSLGTAHTESGHATSRNLRIFSTPTESSEGSDVGSQLGSSVHHAGTLSPTLASTTSSVWEEDDEPFVMITVQNTFIHAVSPSSTPLRRTLSTGALSESIAPWSPGSIGLNASTCASPLMSPRLSRRTHTRDHSVSASPKSACPDLPQIGIVQKAWQESLDTEPVQTVEFGTQKYKLASFMIDW